MPKESVDPYVLKQVEQMAAHFSRFPFKQASFAYDNAKNSVEVTLEPGQGSTESEKLDSGLTLHYRGDKLVGVTLENATWHPRAGGG